MMTTAPKNKLSIRGLDMMNESGDNGGRLVWDLPLRVFHWLLALSFAGSWWTAQAGVDWKEWHFRLGYLAAGLLIFRIIWGFIGPKHSRFSNFIPGPRSVINYLRRFTSKTDPIVSIGHNPVGAIMVFALLLAMGLQVATGLFSYDDILYAGPFNGMVSEETAKSLTRWHHRIFTGLKIFVFLHIAAVFVYVFYKKQNLILAMITGRKPKNVVADDEAIAGSMIRRSLIISGIIAVIIYSILNFAPLPA